MLIAQTARLACIQHDLQPQPYNHYYIPTYYLLLHIFPATNHWLIDLSSATTGRPALMPFRSKLIIWQRNWARRYAISLSPPIILPLWVPTRLALTVPSKVNRPTTAVSPVQLRPRTHQTRRDSTTAGKALDPAMRHRGIPFSAGWSPYARLMSLWTSSGPRKWPSSPSSWCPPTWRSRSSASARLSSCCASSPCVWNTNPFCNTNWRLSFAKRRPLV